MNLLQIINTIIVVIGIPTLIRVFLNIGGDLKTLRDLEADMKNNIRPDLKDIRERFFLFEGKALLESGLKKYLDDNKPTLIQNCEKDKEFKTAYDVQTSVFEFFDNYKFPEEIENAIKTYAYNLGASPEIIKRLGAIYFRKFCLEKHHFKEEDGDSPNAIKRTAYGDQTLQLAKVLWV